MAKIKFIASRKDAQWSFRLNDGRLIEILGFDAFSIRYDTPFSLETGEIIERDPAWPVGYIPEGYTTLNKLKAQGLGDTVYCFDEYDVNMKFPRALSEKKIKAICNEFMEHGFNVTPRAVVHNFNNWLMGYKCGYRDEENGYHLFTPCGGNPFSLRATTLDDRVDWQATYFC